MAIAYQQSPRALLTEPEVAELLGCSCRCLQAWRQSGEGPAWVKLRGMVRYRRADLDAFIAAGARRPQARGRQMTNALPSSQTTPAPTDGALAQDRLKAPVLLTRRCDRTDGSYGHEVWCPWCEKNHHHGVGEGQRGAHCADGDGRSPLAATGYDMRVVQHARASDAPSRFPTGRGFVGKRRFWRSLALSVGDLRKDLIGAILAKRPKRQDLSVCKIPDMPGAPGARVEVGEHGGCLGWSAVYSDGEASYGDNLASLISELFCVPWGVIVVRVIEAVLGVNFDASCALAIAAAVDDWRARGAPKNAGRTA